MKTTFLQPKGWKGIEGNIPKLFALQASKWFILYMPIVALFYMENGLTVGQIMLVQGMYSMTMALFEVPSGYFSDTLGRRRSLIVGMVLSFVGIGMLSQSYGFWSIAGSAITTGFGASFISGTNSALLYDSLLSLNKADLYSKLQGRIYSVGTFAESIAAICGGWLAQAAGFRFTFYLQLIIAFLGIGFAWSLTEVNLSNSDSKATGWANVKRILHYVIFENKALRKYILLSAVLGSATLTTAWFTQPFLEAQNISPGWIGNIWATLNLTVALVSFEAYRIYRVASDRQISIILTVGVAIGFTGVALYYNFYGIAFIYLIYFLRGIASPILLDFVNRITPSDMRASVLSMRGMIIRVLFSIISPFMGWVSDVYTLQQAFLVAGVSFLVLGSLSVFSLWNIFDTANKKL